MLSLDIVNFFSSCEKQGYSLDNISIQLERVMKNAIYLEKDSPIIKKIDDYSDSPNGMLIIFPENTSIININDYEVLLNLIKSSDNNINIYNDIEINNSRIILKSSDLKDSMFNKFTVRGRYVYFIPTVRLSYFNTESSSFFYNIYNFDNNSELYSFLKKVKKNMNSLINVVVITNKWGEEIISRSLFDVKYLKNIFDKYDN